MNDDNTIHKPFDESEPDNARVCAVHRGQYQLLCAHGEVPARLKAGGYYRDDAMQLPTVGDDVRFWYNRGGDSLITATLPRRSLFCRSDFLGASRWPPTLTPCLW